LLILAITLLLICLFAMVRMAALRIVMLAVITKVAFSRRAEVNLNRLQPTKISQADGLTTEAEAAAKAKAEGEAATVEAEKEKAEAEAEAKAEDEAEWFGRGEAKSWFSKQKKKIFGSGEEEEEEEETNYPKKLGKGCKWNNGTERGKTRKEILEAQDESCEQDLVCAEKGVDGRDFGECSNSKGLLKSILHHKMCCSVPTCRYYKEEKYRTCPAGFSSKPNSDSRPVFYPMFKSDSKMTDLEFEKACCTKDDIEHDVMYVPKNMAGQKKSQEKTMEDCAKRCYNVHGCVHFSYWERRGGCHLQASDAKPRVAINVTAGPPNSGVKLSGAWAATRVAWELPMFFLLFQIPTLMQ
jgi:hypothetical protein